jgi:UDP-N-acetylmuramate--alanine ligase
MKKQQDNLSSFHSIHFVGMKGIAMTALAVWAKEQGITVTGSDISEEFPSDKILFSVGISVLNGFTASHITQNRPDAVIYTGAHNGRDNIEVKTALSLHIPCFAHGEALGIAMAGKKQISVAGSHGKTTTSAMIATILTSAGSDPSYAVGCGEIQGLGLPGHFGKGDYFVAEADEYVTDPAHDKTPRFLWQSPDILVVTNVDYDHPDAYASIRQVQEAFLALMAKQKGSKISILNRDDPESAPLLENKASNTIITYGLSQSAMYYPASISYRPGRTDFELMHEGKSSGVFRLCVPGEHNVLNAVAAIICCRQTGASLTRIQKGLAEFCGAKRRFEKLGVVSGVSFYDDYAHHPKEISATLGAVRSWYPNDRLIVVFQPHTYSRTHKFLADFGNAFRTADIVICTDIYASARENDTLGMSGRLFTREVQKHQDHVYYAEGVIDIRSLLRSVTAKGDRVVFMGAGNIFSWGKEIYKSFTK